MDLSGCSWGLGELSKLELPRLLEDLDGGTVTVAIWIVIVIRLVGES